MKRFLALAALVLGLAACQTEPEGLDVIVGGEVDTVVSVSLPEATRANSAEGFDLRTLGNEYKLRYILEIYRVENGITDRSTCQRHIIVDDATNVAFPVRLAPNHKYQFVAWADIVETNNDMDTMKADRYYNTANGLDEISIIKDKWVAMDETRDAFTAKTNPNEDLTLNAINLELRRPFAKLRVVATDYEDVVKLGLKPASATVEYSQENHLPLSFDALTGAASNAEAKSHNTISYATPVYDDEDGEFTLFTDYFFVPTSGTAKFSLNVYADAGLIKANNFNTEIFVEANKLTTIKGDVLTIGGNVKVEVDNGLGELKTINYADNAETLQEIINAAPADGEQTNITLGGNIDLSDLLNAGIFSTRSNEPTYGLLIPADKSIVLDLNGHTISQSKAQTGAYAMIDNKGTLTIEDSSANKSGKIAYGDTGNGGNYVSNTISNSGVLTIKGGTIENNSSATVASNGYPHPIDNSGVLTINGGTFTNNANYSSMRIWCTTDDDTIITINGGTFNGSIDFQTPNASANKGTLTINGGTFNADTYTKCSVRLLGFGADVDEMNGYIKGGHFNGAIALKNWSGSELNSHVFCITGGTFTADPSEFVDDDYNVVENDGVYSLELKDVIAKIGEVKYRSLQKAFDAVDNGTIQLVGDVTLKSSVVLNEGKVATLDLNGKTITGNWHKNVGAIITNNGTLTINGGTISSLGDNGGSAVQNKGALTIENATLNGAPNANGSWPSYTVNNTGAMEAENTTITSYHGAVASYGEGAVATLNNCVIDMAGIAGFTSHGIYTYDNGKVVVNGGTYENKADDQASSGASVINGAVEVNAGSFSGRIENYYGTPVLKGGTYSVKPNDKFVAEGYVVDQTTDGRYSVVLDVKIVKVGNTEYRKIDDAIAAWTNNTTLTLLADVTLSDVITLKSTEHHILNLGTYTMTAASGKNAIEITPFGEGAGTAAKSCLTINADAATPGHINAGNKACVYYKKTNGINDRIMVTINGGVFDGTISSSSNNGGQACPYFVFNGGVFNKSINLSKAMLKVTGGVFHGMFSCTGDSTAHRLISGGTFKSFTFMTADAANKFCIGTDKQTYDVGLYVNDEGYLVVGGPVITEFGDKFAAKATNATKWSSYLQYSSAATNGLYYTNAEMAIKKHGEANVVLQ